jgi:hypothetical protein
VHKLIIGKTRIETKDIIWILDLALVEDDVDGLKRVMDSRDPRPNDRQSPPREGKTAPWLYLGEGGRASLMLEDGIVCGEGGRELGSSYPGRGWCSAGEYSLLWKIRLYDYQ